MRTKAEEKGVAAHCRDLPLKTYVSNGFLSVMAAQGDVGCGKTAVAFLALLAAAGSGYQGALMAPTEVLAGQTYAKLGALLAALPENLRPSAVLLTGSAKAKERREVCDDFPCSSSVELPIEGSSDAGQAVAPGCCGFSKCLPISR